MQYWKSHNFVQKKDELRVHEQILEWSRNGTIERVSESSKYCSPIVGVPKKTITENQLMCALVWIVGC